MADVDKVADAAQEVEQTITRVSEDLGLDEYIELLQEVKSTVETLLDAAKVDKKRQADGQ